jgi:Lrp/AsnC family leucine-responsive transcriptional regulator
MVIYKREFPMHLPDDLDIKILTELENNARISISELARHLEYPTSTVRDRIRGLEESGVIRGYSAVIDPKKLGMGIKAVIQVVRSPSVPLDDIFSETDQTPEFTDVQILTGEVDELVTIYARDVDHLKEILYTRFGKFKGVESWNTCIVLDERSYPLTRHLHHAGIDS